MASFALSATTGGARRHAWTKICIIRLYNVLVRLRLPKKNPHSLHIVWYSLPVHHGSLPSGIYKHMFHFAITNSFNLLALNSLLHRVILYFIKVLIIIHVHTILTTPSINCEHSVFLSLSDCIAEVVKLKSEK